jgi:hypothetical protein
LATATGSAGCLLRQQAETRRTVHQRDVVADHVDELPSEDELIRRRAPRLPRRKRGLRRRKIKAPVRPDGDIPQTEQFRLEQDVRDGVPILHIDCEDLRRRRLRIQVNQQHRQVLARKRDSQAERDRRLPNTAFLVCERVGHHLAVSFVQACMRACAYEEGVARLLAPSPKALGALRRGRSPSSTASGDEGFSARRARRRRVKTKRGFGE